MVTNLSLIRGALAVLLFVTLTGCSQDGHESRDSAAQTGALPRSPQVPSPGLYTVSGYVIDFESGMIPNADVNLDIGYGESFIYSYWWVHGPLRSDDLGHFVASKIPNATIGILAFKAGYVQPCAVILNVDQDVEVYVEMLPVSMFAADAVPRPQSSVEPSLTGVIYENTESGHKPVAGAQLWAEYPLMIGAATTLSNNRGQYFVCNLSQITDLYVSAPDFETTIVSNIDTGQTPYLEIELKRLTGAP